MAFCNLIWLQKAKWFVDGERNTQFFHMFEILKKKRRHIPMLKGCDEHWIEYKGEVQVLVKEFFVKLYTCMLLVTQVVGSSL